MEFRKDIEGLRALAVAAVVLYHGEVPGFGGGYVGVDVFFVISGFLITGQLVRDQDHSALARIRHFYVRRIRRILPAATATIVITLAVAALVQPPLLLHGTRADAVAAMFFYSNVHFSRDAVDYFRQGDAPSLFQHFWSLSVEEQFYFVWPGLLVVAGLVAATRRRAAYGVIVVAVFVGSFAAGVLLTRSNPTTAFYLLPARAWELAVGALLAIWGRPIVTSLRLAAVARIVGLSMIVTAIATFDRVAYFPGYAALLPVVGTALVVAAGMVPGKARDAGVLGLAPLQWLGRYSYSIYLWHWPVMMLAATDHRGLLRTWPQAVSVMVVGALPAAVASYHAIEQPFRVGFARRPDRDALLAGVAILTAGAVFLAGYGAIAIGPLHTGRRADPVAAGSLRPTPFVPANLHPTLLDAHTGGNEAERSCNGSLNPCVLGDPEADTTVVLYGDSHALHWLAAFDEAGKQNHWRVVTRVRPGCSSFLHPPAVKFLRCDGFRRGAIDFIASVRPDLVVLSNSASLALDELKARMGDGVQRALQQLPAEVPVAVFGQTPTALNDVPACLSDRLNDTRRCEPTPTSGDVRAINRQLRAAVAGTQATFVDATPLVCGRRCPTIIGNVLVYRDDDHVTYDFARTRARVLASLVGPLLSLSA
ncbi:MAG TPA: acyltransferase family protein [Acidimicrobiales bacterium]|nr:acyltransferase family protein [Acidimicrobiales bacterium]